MMAIGKIKINPTHNFTITPYDDCVKTIIGDLINVTTDASTTAANKTHVAILSIIKTKTMFKTFTLQFLKLEHISKSIVKVKWIFGYD